MAKVTIIDANSDRDGMAELVAARLRGSASVASCAIVERAPADWDTALAAPPDVVVLFPRRRRYLPDLEATAAFEGRFYSPLRYYIGGQDFLSGYPYFALSGSKILYGRLGYGLPLVQRLSTRFANATFTTLRGELFAEAGAVGNFDGLDAGDLDGGDFLYDVGAEVRMQLFSFYRIPMSAFVQVARPLSRDRVPGPRIDKYRYYFGLRM